MLLFTLLWLQHQHLAWTFPGLEAADTPSFDCMWECTAASSPHHWWMFWQVLFIPRANEQHFCAKGVFLNETYKHRECGLITNTALQSRHCRKRKPCLSSKKPCYAVQVWTYGICCMPIVWSLFLWYLLLGKLKMHEGCVRGHKQIDYIIKQERKYLYKN